MLPFSPSSTPAWPNAFTRVAYRFSPRATFNSTLNLKIFIEDIDGDGTLTAKWCFGVGEIRLVASEGCATKTGDFQ